MTRTCSCSGCSVPLPAYLTKPLSLPRYAMTLPRSPQARTADAIDDLREQVAELSSVVERLTDALESRS